jgi:hypothetical protein
MLANDENMLFLDRMESMKTRRSNIDELRDPEGGLFSEEVELDEGQVERSDELIEVQIEMGKREDLKTRIANLMMSYIDIIQKSKTLVDYSYDKIRADVRSSKIKEKNMIIERLKKMTIEERRIENMMKTYKIGKWNVGQQKGLFIYDVATQERERQELIEQGVKDNEDIYNLAYSELDIDEASGAVSADEIFSEELAEQDLEAENELYDFANLGENYDEGYEPDGYVEEEDFPED